MFCVFCSSSQWNPNGVDAGAMWNPLANGTSRMADTVQVPGKGSKGGRGVAHHPVVGLESDIASIPVLNRTHEKKAERQQEWVRAARRNRDVLGSLQRTQKSLNEGKAKWRQKMSRWISHDEVQTGDPVIDSDVASNGADGEGAGDGLNDGEQDARSVGGATSSSTSSGTSNSGTSSSSGSTAASDYATDTENANAVLSEAQEALNVNGGVRAAAVAAAQ